MALVPPTSQGTGVGTVESVSAADGSIVVGGSPTDNPTIRTGTLDAIATAHPPVAAVAMNAQKVTGLANGTVSTDAAAFGQVSGNQLAAPVVITGSGTWVPSTTGRAIFVATLVGGGGGGNNGTATQSGGGGGGGQLIDFYYLGNVVGNQTVTIGAGGAAAVDGGTTSIGALISAAGGYNGSTTSPVSTNGTGVSGNTVTGNSNGTLFSPGSGGTSQTGAGVGQVGLAQRQRLGCGGGSGGGQTSGAGGPAGDKIVGFTGGTGAALGGGGGASANAVGSNGAAGVGGAGGAAAVNTGNGGGGGGAGTAGGAGGAGGTGLVIIYQIA